MKDEEQEAAKFDAVFPCILSIIPGAVFNKKDPIIVGVDVEEGIAKVGRLLFARHSILDLPCTLLCLQVPVMSRRIALVIWVLGQLT